MYKGSPVAFLVSFLTSVLTSPVVGEGGVTVDADFRKKDEFNGACKYDNEIMGESLTLTLLIAGIITCSTD